MACTVGKGCVKAGNAVGTSNNSFDFVLGQKACGTNIRSNIKL